MMAWRDTSSCGTPQLATKANLNDCEATPAATAAQRTPLWLFDGSGTDDPADDSLVYRSPLIDPSRPVIPVMHGYLQSQNAEWAKSVARCLQQRDPTAQIVIVDASKSFNPDLLPSAAAGCLWFSRIPWLRPGCNVFDITYRNAAKFAEARMQTDQVAADIAAQLRCGLTPGQRLNIPMLVGHSLGAHAGARTLPYLYSVADIGTLVMVDPPDDSLNTLFQPDATNEFVYAGFAKRIVHMYSDDRTAGGAGNRITGSANPNVVQLRSGQTAGGAAADLELDHSRLIRRLPEWLCSTDGIFRTRPEPLALGEATSFQEVGTSMAFQNALGPWASEPSFAELQRQRIGRFAATGPFVELTEQVKAFTNVIGAQTPGEVRLQAPDSTRAGFSYGDVFVGTGQGFISMEYRFCGDCGAATGEQPQVASVWVNDRLAWSTRLNTPPGEWRTAIVSVQDVTNTTARVAAAISRRAGVGNGSLVIRNVRMIPASAAALPCPADFNDDGSRDVSDIFAFLSAWFAGAPGADVDASGVRDVADIFAFLSVWFAGC